MIPRAIPQQAQTRISDVRVLATAALCCVLLLGACGRGGNEQTDAAPAPAAPAPAASPQPDQTSSSPDAQSGAAADSSTSKAKVIDTAFVPRKLMVEAGTKVTWRQIGDQPHSVTAVDGSFDSSPKCSPLKSDFCDFEGDSYSFVFEQPGTFEYYCRIHGLPTGRGMTGTVVVE